MSNDEAKKQTENEWRKIDRKVMEAILDGRLTGCLRMKSTGARNFLLHEMYHDQARDGCIEAEYLRRFKNEEWFNKTFVKNTAEIP